MSKEEKNQHGSKRRMQESRKEECKLLLIDFDQQVVGVEDVRVFGIHDFVELSEEKVSGTDFRTVTDTLALCSEKGSIHPSGKKCEGGWNPEGFHGGLMAGYSAIGPLGVVRTFLKKKITKKNVGQVVHGKEGKYIIRSCPADLMPLRLMERYRKGSDREYSRQERMTFSEVRRLCFAQRNAPRPEYVFFAKGTTRVAPPAGAVARLGGSESSTVVFLDKFARPICAYKSAGDFRDTYAVEIPIPEDLDWQRLRSLGKSTRDIYFGVRG